MPLSYKTPGVYLAEQSSAPSIVQTETALPAFIGYTARAQRDGRSLRRRPTRVSSITDFLLWFGPLPAATPGAASLRPRFAILPASDAASADVNFANGAWNLQADASTRYLLLNSVRLFFENGGRDCFVVSVGPFRRARRHFADDANPNIKLPEMLGGVTSLEREKTATIIVAPDATLLSPADHAAYNRAALQHCERTGGRIAILDVRGGDTADAATSAQAVADFRFGVGDVGLRNGCAYHPYLKANLYSDADLNYQHMGGARAVAAALPDAKAAPVAALLAQMRRRATSQSPRPTDLDAALRASSAPYVALHHAMLTRAGTLPPSGAMAGVMAMTDDTRGVWKAPANVRLSAVTGLTLNPDTAFQEALNIDPATGKSINVIRSIAGQGVLVWGARTLDGNSGDWRYVSVRRTTLMVEQSIKLALQTQCFSPNTADTWMAIRSMIENFLTTLWQRGGLSGAKPDQAFAVRVGLGSTMTAQDVLDGALIVNVMLALTRPAEFVVVNFHQQMVKA